MPELDLMGYEREQRRLRAMGDVTKGALKLAKGAIYDPIANVADMLNWKTYPDGQGGYVHVAPSGEEYTDQQYQAEIMRRTGGMTLAALGLNRTPGVGAVARKGAVASASPMEMPAQPGTSLATRPVVHDAIPINDIPVPTVRGTPNPIGPQGTIVPPSGAGVPRLPQAEMAMVKGSRGNFNPLSQNEQLFTPSGADVPRLPQAEMSMIPGRRGNFNTAGANGTIVPPTQSQPFQLPYEKANNIVRSSNVAAGTNPVIDAVARGNPNPIGPQGPIVTPTSSSIPRLTSSVPPSPPPRGPAPMPAVPPANASPAAVRSWFSKLSPKAKAALGVATGGAGIALATMNRAAETARKQQAQPAAAGSSSSPSDWQGPPNLSDFQGPEFPTTAAKTTPAPFKARAAATMRAATGGKAQGAGAGVGTVQAAATDMTAGQPSGTDKVPVTTTGRPDYNYYAEIMNASDRNDAYARDLINLKEQARMAAIDAAARGEKFRFVPVKDYMNNRIIFVNAGGNDVVLDMNDPRQGVEYQKLLDKAGIDPAAMTDWMHRSSKPVLRYMQPVGGNRDVTPDFGFARRSVEMGAGGAMADADKYKLPDIAHVGSTELSKFGQTRGMDLEPEAEMPMPTATPPSTRPEPQPTAVASVAPQPEEDPYAEVVKRAQEQRKAAGMTPAQARRIDQSKKWL